MSKSNSANKETLFKRIGGMEAIVAAGDLFYGKVLQDKRIRHFFKDLDIQKQTKKLVSFMAWAFGAPIEYKGRDLRTAHLDLVKKQGLNNAHFDAVAENLEATLRELEVSPELIDEAMAIVASTRKEVLNK